jgi:GNAT superfamily N-acetyltransferase
MKREIARHSDQCNSAVCPEDPGKHLSRNAGSWQGLDAVLSPALGDGLGGILAFELSPPMIAIRAATTADLPRILQFIRQLAAYEKLSHEVEATEARLRATLFPAEGRPAAECLLAFWHDQPAGFAVFFHNYSTFLARPGLYLEDLFVEPACRGRGIGRALLQHCAQLANTRGCGRMEWTVLDWNESAKGFYQKFGAVEMDGWRLCRLAGPALARHA